jgi:predicted dehydrogenase
VRWTEGRNLEAFVDLLASGRLDVKPLVSHRFPIEQAPQAYELITGKRDEPFLGVLLTYGQGTAGGGSNLTDQTTSTILDVSRGRDIPGTSKSTDHLSTVRLGVLGAGNFATAVMLPALRKVPQVELVGIASASGTSAQHAAARFGFGYAASDERRILEDPQINMVAILTRHHLHARQAIAALRAGKHVFCEKPLAIRPAELEEVARALAEQAAGEERLLMVGFNRRFAPLALRLKRFVDQRQEPLAAHYRVNAGPIPLDHWTQDPEQGGGRLIGEGCHFIDFLIFLVGEAPRQVSVQSLPGMGRYREDNLVMTFTFPDGSLGTVSYLANGDKAFPKERVEVFCSGRAAALDDFRTLELVYKGRRETHRSPLRQDKGHRAEWEAFMRAVLADEPPPIPYAQIFSGMRATFAAVEALRGGREVAVTSG